MGVTSSSGPFVQIRRQHPMPRANPVAVQVRGKAAPYTRDCASCTSVDAPPPKWASRLRSQRKPICGHVQPTACSPTFCRLWSSGSSNKVLGSGHLALNQNCAIYTKKLLDLSHLHIWINVHLNLPHSILMRTKWNSHGKENHADVYSIQL